jgi:hypothetical protein
MDSADVELFCFSIPIEANRNSDNADFINTLEHCGTCLRFTDITK